MLGKSLASPFLTFEPAKFCSFSLSELSTTPNVTLFELISHHATPNAQNSVLIRKACNFVGDSRKWAIQSTAQPESAILLEDEDGKMMWDTCRLALSAFNFSHEEADVILRKAFGWVHSPYWGEERPNEVPKIESVNEMLEYLRSLGLSDDDICKLLKKFPEVLGCNLANELKINVQTLEKEWGINGKSLRNLLLRNPKVLGYNIDCKGDCMAKCTRCWVRF